MTTLQQFPKPHAQTAGRVFEGEAVLILADTSEVNVLNGVGSRIFELCDGEHSVEQIVNTIVTEYNVTQEEAMNDVTTFIDDLVQQNILTVS